MSHTSSGVGVKIQKPSIQVIKGFQENHIYAAENDASKIIYFMDRDIKVSTFSQ